MAKPKKSSSIKERAKHRTSGVFRCLFCFERVKPPAKSTQYTCPNCGYAWRIWWFGPNEPRIRGPVWEAHEKLTQQKMTEMEEK